MFKRRLLALTTSVALLLPAAGGWAQDRNEDTYRQLKLFGDVFERVRADYVDQVTDEELIESAIRGMLAELDPHSSYMDQDQFKDMQEQTRGEAWGIRNVADAANLAPDGFVEKPYLTQKVNNNLAYWGNTYVLSPNYPCIRYWQTGSNLPSGGRPDDTLAANCMYYASPWQDDFMLLVLAHLKDIGFDSRALVNCLGTTAIDRFSAAGFYGFRGASYHIPTHYDDGTGIAPRCVAVVAKRVIDDRRDGAAVDILPGSQGPVSRR